MTTIDATKVVSKDQFEAQVAAAFQQMPRVDTPADEVQTLADLLGVSPGTLGGETAVGFPKGGEVCSNCGRAFSFLDVAETALKVHSKEFLVDAITGKHGYIVNSDAQPFNCRSCGTKYGGVYVYLGWLYMCVISN
ncbi:hypothetical protein FB451DRAFT_278803 [Mycena latifolia]|nr:hypothetical protein FB451DRAFT_278803 [Mycena latifolia]